ncbi:MAG: TauD/TfdA family dioxygenase [Gammaproteobacteria bacterium]|nr:TauD/TfdA family dioxygenase [Gammaproteobacteria bacterium]
MTVEIENLQIKPWTGRKVWDGRELGKSENWLFELQDSLIEELQQAVNRSLSSSKPLAQQSHKDFNLPRLGTRLFELRSEVLNGRGFTLIRGLAGTDWSDAELIRAYWIVGSYFGDPVSQNARADLLGHVTDLRLTDTSEVRLYQTSAAQPFHSDSCDIVGLLCLRPAKCGGESSIASSATIHNELLRERPEALKILYGEFQCDRFGEIPMGKEPHYPVRVFNSVAGDLVCCGMDPDIRLAPRLDGVDPLTESQLSALDAFQDMAQETALNMMLQRGDIQLVNNLTVVHAREAFEDYSELERRRHLVRLWLSSAEGRELPEFLTERWGNIAVGSVRGGILVPGATPEVNFEPG